MLARIITICQFVVIAAIIALTCCRLSARVKPTKIPVLVNFNTDDAAFKDRVMSAVNRELRNLGDVVLVPDWSAYSYAIDIVGVETKKISGRNVGFALAVNYSIVEPLNNVHTKVAPILQLRVGGTRRY